MKKILTSFNALLFLIAGGSLASYGKPVSKSIAMQVGCNQLLSVGAPGVQTVDDLEVAYTATSSQAATGLSVDYYVFNIKGQKGFVMVSGDDNIIPILAFSTESAFNLDNMAPATKDWIEGYQNQIHAAVAYNIPAQEGTPEQWQSLMVAPKNGAAKKTAVSALLKTQWDQDGSYKSKCPTGTYTGCVATSMAQVMNYWGWPTKGCGYHTYTHATYGVQKAFFDTTTYNWTALQASTSVKVNSGSSSAARTAVGILMYHCGVAVDMNYGTTASGAYTLIKESPKVNCSEYALKTYFHYKRTIRGVQRYVPSVMGASAWGTIIKGELDANRPVLYSGQGSSGGHAWVCDGWNSSSMFHFNWGWSGSSDGYFTVDNLAPPTLGIGGGGGNFNSYQAIIIGIEPDSFATDNASSSVKLASQLSVSYSSPVSSPATYPLSAFNMIATIGNPGTAAFDGDFTVHVFDEKNNYVTALTPQTGKTVPAGGTLGLTMASSGIMYSMIPGFYRLRVMYKPKGSSTWSAVGNSGTYINEDNITVNNGQGIALGSDITLPSTTGTNVKTGTKLDVKAKVSNFSSSTFNGSVRAVLTNVVSGSQTPVEVKTGALIYYNSGTEYNFSLATVPTSLPSGTYTIAIQHQSTSSTTWTYTGSDYYLNPIIVTIGAGGVSVPYTTIDAESIHVYPNPSNDIVNVGFEGVKLDRITLTDIQGRVQTEVRPAANEVSATLSVSALSNGIYFVNLFSGSEVVTKKIAVVK